MMMTTGMTMVVMTTETTETTTDPVHRSGMGDARGRLASIRVRLLASFVVVLALATVASIVVVRTILVNRADEQIDSELTQEAGEMRKLSRGNDPDTGEPFNGRVRRIFDVFLERNIAARHEAQLTFVDGRPYLRSPSVVPYRLDRDPELVEMWGTLTRSERGRVETPGGAVEYLAVPLHTNGETRGVFVVAVFRDLWLEEVQPATYGAAGVGLLILLIGSLLAWRMADRILDPVETVTRAARGISETDLRRRIEVSGTDEIARLAQTFNEMLDRLEEAFVSQRRFIDDAGHELRTPITIIQGQLEVLSDDPDDRAKALEIVMDELDRMNRFVNDLLLLARVQQSDFLSLETVDLAVLSDELFTKAASLGDRRWMVDDVGRGLIVADRQRVTQAVMQLAQNAAQHTQPEDEIALGSAVKAGHAFLWVRDSGPGIPPSEQTRIFDRFARGSRNRSGDGAGLGLSIVKAIAEAHHGSIELESRQGDGTKFTMVLPIDQPEPEDR
jgi:signal transduction histidine kinase